jgi:sugar fermentation stimulation protein A
MDYIQIKRGIFLERPNRFIAHVLVDGVIETAHVKNTGRCKELLIPGSTIILERAKNPERKTAYSLIAVYKGEILINMDSQAPNQVLDEALRQGRLPQFGKLTRIVREVRYGNSRFDLYYEKGSVKGFIEVKGVTLERDGKLFFPDAPTERGTKHVRELIKAVQAGYEGCIFFLIQMRGAVSFEPNSVTDPQFTEALCQAYAGGVQVMAYDSFVTEDGIQIGSPVRIKL